MINAVVFDMDGVIFDSENMIMKCWKQVASKYEIEDIEVNWLKCIGMNSQSIKATMLTCYGENFPYDKLKGEANILFGEMAINGLLPLKKGAKELLDWLKLKKILIALASSTSSKYVIPELKAAGLYDYFDYIICGDMVSKSKPEPDIYLEACNQLNMKPGTVYAIEDSYNGVRSAHGAGLKTIMVPDMLPATEEMRTLAAEVMNDLIVVKEYFEKHN